MNFVHKRCYIFKYTFHCLDIPTATILGNDKRFSQFFGRKKKYINLKENSIVKVEESFPFL
jgi:hypothetical protein